MILYLLTKTLENQNDLDTLIDLMLPNDFLLCLDSAKDILSNERILVNCQIGILETESDQSIAKSIKRLTKKEWIELSLSADKVIHWNLGL